MSKFQEKYNIAQQSFENFILMVYVMLTKPF